MRVLILAAAAATLAACGQSAPETYPPQFELNFMRACQAQGPSQQFCSCTWEKVEADIAPSDFATFEALPEAERAANPVQQQLERFATECAAQLAPVEDPPPP